MTLLEEMEMGLASDALLIFSPENSEEAELFKRLYTVKIESIVPKDEVWILDTRALNFCRRKF